MVWEKLVSNLFSSATLAVIVVLLIVGTGVGGFVFGKRYESGQHARAEQLIKDTGDAAQRAAAEAIAANRPKWVTVQSKVEEKIREVPVYRDCVQPPDVERMLDDARANRLPAQPVDDRVVPGSAADVPQGLR